MPDAPTLTVVITTHGRGTLGQAVRSARAADAIIVVSHGPRMSAREMTPYNACLMEVPAELVLDPACQPVPMRNLGFDWSRTSHVAWLDDDDVYLPGAIDLMRVGVAEAPDRPHLFPAMSGHPRTTLPCCFVLPRSAASVLRWRSRTGTKEAMLLHEDAERLIGPMVIHDTCIVQVRP